jgi:hypothetical protein
MDYFFKLTTLGVLLLAALLTLHPARADTYPAVATRYDAIHYFNFTTAVAACNSENAVYGLTTPGSIGSTGLQYCKNAGGTIIFQLTIAWTCPNTGTRTGSAYPFSCINATPCLSPLMRALVAPYACFTPVECHYPESDNGSGICANTICASGLTRNPLTNLCQTRPTCAMSEFYDVVSNSCKLYPLNCPGHSHASTTNDQCLPDAPNACPVGQHDDGTYTCVADNATRCKSNQQEGTIFGVLQCINKANTPELTQTADSAELAAAATKVTQDASKAALDAANVALAADPGNVSKQNAANAANTAFLGAQYANSNAQQTAQKLQDDVNTGALKNIADAAQKSADLAKIAADKKTAEDAAGFGTVPSPETLPNSAITLATEPNYSASGACPAPVTIVTSFRSFSFSFDYLCQFADGISSMVIALAWLAAGKIVFSAVV